MVNTVEAIVLLFEFYAKITNDQFEGEQKASILGEYFNANLKDVAQTIETQTNFKKMHIIATVGIAKLSNSALESTQWPNLHAVQTTHVHLGCPNNMQVVRLVLKQMKIIIAQQQ